MNEVITLRFVPKFEDLIKRLGADIIACKRAGLINVVETIEARAVMSEKKYAKTGNLVGGISSSVNAEGTRGVINATAKNEEGQDYASFVHDGTGIYGPHKTKIVPTKKKALYWTGAGHPFRSVLGMEGRHFLTRAAGQTSAQKVFDAGITNYLRAKGWA